MDLRKRLIDLYPRTWRERYGDEFGILLDECLHSPLDVLDIFLGALDAHLEFPYEMSWRLINMTNKLRTSILMVFTAFIGFIIGGLSLQALVDDSPVGPLMRTNLPVLAAWTTIEAGAAIALLAVVIGGLPLALTVIRRALTSSRRDLSLLLVPVWAFGALILYSGFLALVASGSIHISGVARSVSPGNFPLGNCLLLGGLMLVFLLGAAASAAAVWKVVSNADGSETTFQILGQQTFVKLYHHAFLPAVVTTLAMLLMLLATLAFAWMAGSLLPDWFHGNNGLLLVNTSISLSITILVMVLSTALACFGVLRGYGFWRNAEAPFLMDYDVGYSSGAHSTQCLIP